MIHRGVEYSMTLAAPGFWTWQFRIGDTIKTGKTETRLQLLAMRRVQTRIDRELKRTRQTPVQEQAKDHVSEQAGAADT